MLFAITTTFRAAYIMFGETVQSQGRESTRNADLSAASWSEEQPGCLHRSVRKHSSEAIVPTVKKKVSVQ